MLLTCIIADTEMDISDIADRIEALYGTVVNIESNMILIAIDIGLAAPFPWPPPCKGQSRVPSYDVLESPCAI